MLKKTFDALEILTVAGLVLGLAWSLLRLLPEPVMYLPQPVVFTAAILALLAAVWLAELFMPLQAVSETNWVYVLRPKAKIRTMDLVAVGNLLGFLLMGAFIGVVVGRPTLWAAVALLLRVLPLLQWRRRLPGLLAAGQRRTVGTAGLYIHDSELVSQGLAVAAGRFRPAKPTSNLWVLFFRRLHRRYYLLLVALILLGSAIVVSCLYPKFAVGFFLMGWSMVTAAIIRCTNFMPLVGAHHVSFTVLVVCAILGAAVIAMIWGKPILIPLVVLGIGASGWKRAKPREVVSFAVIDTGQGVTLPMGQLQYFGAGLVPATVVAGLMMVLV